MPGRFDRAVVDAGPLLDILTITYARKYGRDSVLTRAGVPIDIDIHNGYIRLFSDIRIVLSTASVVGELQGLQNSKLRLRGSHLADFWLHAADFLAMKKFDERWLALLELCRQERSLRGLCRVGPTDMGLIELALKEGCVLLTNDKDTLAAHAWELGLDCRLARSLVGFRER